jgi:hypothetical protein
MLSSADGLAKGLPGKLAEFGRNHMHMIQNPAAGAEAKGGSHRWTQSVNPNQIQGK